VIYATATRVRREGRANELYAPRNVDRFAPAGETRRARDATTTLATTTTAMRDDDGRQNAQR